MTEFSFFNTEPNDIYFIIVTHTKPKEKQDETLINKIIYDEDVRSSTRISSDDIHQDSNNINKKRAIHLQIMESFNQRLGFG